MRMAPTILWGAIALAALTGCTKSTPVTEVVILVDSDFAVPDEVASVVITVRNRDDKELAGQTFTLGPNLTFPFSFTLAPTGMAIDEQVAIELTTRDRAEATVSTRQVQMAFIKETRVLLPLYLPRSCRNRTCNVGMTCTEHGCEGVAVDAAKLPQVEPGNELSHDAGMVAPPADAGASDSGVNTGADSGVPHCFQVPCTSGQTCVDLSTANACASRSAPCECKRSCDPFGPNLCAQREACRWIDVTREDEGACIALGGGLDIGAACTVTLSAAGVATSDPCNATKNLVCAGVGTGDNRGVCSPRCRPRTDQCPRLYPGTSCAFQTTQYVTVGTCATAPAPTASVQLGGGCAVPDVPCGPMDICTEFSGGPMCTADCDDLKQCPVNSACVRQTDGNARCFLTCDVDDDCRNRNSTALCQMIGARKVCAPSCSRADQCRAPAMCNMASGHCE